MFFSRYMWTSDRYVWSSIHCMWTSGRYVWS